MKRPTFLPGDAVCDELCLVTKSCPSLCVPMDCSPPGSSVHRILQARTLEWVAISSSKVSSQLRDRTYISYVGRQILYHRATWDEPADSLPAGNPGWGVSSGGQDGSQAQERSSQPLASPLGRSLSTPSFPPLELLSHLPVGFGSSPRKKPVPRPAPFTPPCFGFSPRSCTAGGRCGARSRPTTRAGRGFSAWLTSGR